MSPAERLAAALASDDPHDAVGRLAAALRDEGTPQVDLYLLFEAALIAADAEDTRYDALADTMDGIWGGPWAKGGALYPTELTNEILASAREQARGQSDR